MGYLVQSRCVDSQELAHALYFGSVDASFSAGGTSLYESLYVLSSSVGRSSGSGWSRETREYAQAGGSLIGVSYVDMAAVSFPSCNSAEGFSDGVVVGWGFGSALILVACLKMMRKGAR